MSAARGHALFKKLLQMEGEAVSYLPFDLAASEKFEGWEEGIDGFKEAVSLTALVTYEFTERVLAAIGEDVEYSCVLELSTAELESKGIALKDRDVFTVGGKTYHVTRFRETRHYGGSPASVLVALSEGKP
jgi:hypothetical protein